MTHPTDDELVKRLRAIDQYSVEDCFVQSALYEKSADRIEALTAENAALESRAEADRCRRTDAGRPGYQSITFFEGGDMCSGFIERYPPPVAIRALAQEGE